MKKRQLIGASTIARMGSKSRRGAIVCLLAASAATGGCYGRFPLTHAVYNANGSIGNPVLKNVVFWVLVWFPVYGFAALGDAVIMNVIEFWSGSSLDLHLHVSDPDGGGSTTLTSSEDGNTLDVLIKKEGTENVTIRFVRLEDGKYEMRDGANEVKGQVIRTPEGDFNLTDAAGRTVRTIKSTEIASAFAG